MKTLTSASAAARARWAAVAALSLLAAGLPSSALAGSSDRATFDGISFSDRVTSTDRSTPSERSSGTARSTVSAKPSAGATATISGKVVIPPTIEAGDEVYVDSYVYSEEREQWELGEYDELDPLGDGTFLIEGLDPDVEYRLHLDIYADGYASGFYNGPGAPLVREPDYAKPVPAPSSGYVLEPVKLGSLSGTFDVPAGFDWSAGGFALAAIELSAAEEPMSYAVVTVTEASNGKFVIDDIHPGSAYVIGAHDELDRFPSGWYHAGADGLVVEIVDATPVTIDSTAHLPIGKHVAPKLSAVTPPSVSGTPAAGQWLTATRGTWSVLLVEVAYQWLRDGVAIPGATSSTYQVAPGDSGAKLAVRVTGSRDDLGSATATSAPTAIALLAAPRTTKAPTVKGTARLGKTLRATPGTWDVAGVQVSYQWLRAGKAINGATSAKYSIKKKDVGKRISVRVTARKAGHADGASSSAAKKVAKAKPKVTAKAKSVKVGKRAKVVVKVKAAGVAKPKGTVLVKYGKKTIKVKLKAKSKGKVVVRLPKLAKGKHAIRASFKPSGATKKYVTSAKAKKVTLRVR